MYEIASCCAPCDRCHDGCCYVQVFLPTIPFSIFWLSISPWTPAWVDVLAATSAALVAMSQQFHGWAHTRKSHLPAAVIALQVTYIAIINALLMLHELSQDMCCTCPDQACLQFSQHTYSGILAVSLGMGGLCFSKIVPPELTTPEPAPSIMTCHIRQGLLLRYGACAPSQTGAYVAGRIVVACYQMLATSCLTHSNRARSPEFLL